MTDLSEYSDLREIRLATLYEDLAESLAQLREAHPGVLRARAAVEASIQDGQAYYGINTGFGILASQRISRGDLARLQRNLILSHAVGLGRPIPR